MAIPMSDLSDSSTSEAEMPSLEVHLKQLVALNGHKCTLPSQPPFNELLFISMTTGILVRC